MPHYNLPHNHGQNMERVLNKMPHTEDFTDIAFLFQQLGDPTRLRILLWYCKQNVTDSLSKIGTSSTLKTLKKP